MVLPPILDPDGAGPPYSRGDEVEVAGMTVVYEGTAAAEDGYIAVFAVSGPMPAQPSALFFLPEGPSVQLMADGGEVVSAPFHLRGMPASDTLFAWRIGTETIVWELGPIDGP